jgi:hypothetical protein
MWPQGRRAAERAREGAMEEALGRTSGSGGMIATLISALALVFSGYTFDESVLRAPELAVYVPPSTQYTDPDRPDSPVGSVHYSGDACQRRGEDMHRSVYRP